jgi:MYXO-CTERM domain-containing protein
MKLRLLLAGLSACSALVVATSAHAAPAPACTPATMSPRAATIPVNLPGFAYTALSATANDVHLFDAASSSQLPVVVGPVVDGLMKVVPSNPLIAGKSYRLEFSPMCSYGPVPPATPISFTAVAEAPLPTKLAAPLAAPTVVLRDYGTTSFTITTSTTLEPEIKPWLSIYQLVLLLDGKLVATKATVNNDAVQVVADGWCDAAFASTSKHTIQLRGRLPFAPTVDTLGTEVTFDCPAPVIGTPPNTPPTAPPPGTTPPGTPGAPVVTNGTHAGGCSVSANGASSSSLPLLGVAIGLLAAITRRRRAQRL